MTMELIQNIIRTVINKIKPDELEKQRLYQIFMHIKDSLIKCIHENLGQIEVDITLQGSVAKDTFLKGESDIDVFILFSPEENITIDWFKNEFIPMVLKCFSDYKYVLNYASHPYVTLYVDGVEVNVVPAYKVPSPDKILAAVDRTPFHTNYVKSHLNESQKDDVRVLKQFLKTWKLYGAETEVQGFSGYLAELLIIAYGNFYNLLINASNWRAYRTCIDIEHHYPSTKECLNRFRRNVLIVVDPVDQKKTAAAAVSLKKFSMFKFLSKIFIENPSMEFFFDEHKPSLNLKNVTINIENRLKNYDSCLYILTFEIEKPIPEMVSGQLLRLKKSILNTLRSSINDRSIYADVWIDKERLNKAILVVELMHCSKRYKLHVGPYAFDVPNAINFLKQNILSDVGPWIDDDGRLYTLKLMNKETITKTILNIVRSTSFNGIIFKDIAIITTAIDLDLVKHRYAIDNEFVYWLEQFLERKPFKKIYSLISTSLT